ncbi:DHA2 family efflux MFS transporter permease subunit [Bifidobacterium oedipodis]|nr:DHA2 family efflux MFS transporter permease subunit [Bifidobacterium sp. DSM 109957]
MIFLNVVVACVATSMLATSMTTALPALIEDLRIDAIQGQWVTSGYSLAMAVVMPLTAFLVTRFPTKPLYVFGLLLNAVGVAMCAISPSFLILMVSRVLQALGNGVLGSMAQVILLTIYPRERRGTVMGWYGLSVSAAPLIAPILAGFIVDMLGWRWIFWGMLPIILIAVVWAFVSFDNVLETHQQRFDALSFLLSVILLSGITLGMGSLGTVASYVELGCGLIAGILFTVRQLRAERPFLDLRVFENRNFTISVIAVMLFYLVMMGSSTIIPLYVQSIVGASAVVSALVVLPGSAASAVVSPLAGKLYDRFGMRPLLLVAAALLVTSNTGMLLVVRNTPLWVAALFNVMRCIAIGCLLMPLLTWGTEGMSSSDTAHANALFSSLRTTAGAIGTVVFVAMMEMGAGGAVIPSRAVAGVHGMHIAFLGMAVGSVALLAIGLLFARRRTR